MRQLAKDFIQRLRKSEIVNGVATLSIGSTISQAIPIISSLVLARLYTPNDFGDWGVFSSYVSILSIIICGRYEYAILRPQKTVDAINLVILSLIICIFICILLFLFNWIAYGLKLEFINNIPHYNWIPIYLLGVGLLQIYINYSNRQEKYKNIAYSSIVRSSAQACLRISFGFRRIHGGLIIGTVISMYLAIIPLIKDFPLSHIKKIFSKRQIIIVAHRYKKFPLYEVPSGLLNAMSTNIPVILLSYFFLNEYVGYFSMSITILYLPIAFIGSAFGQVFYKKACVWEDRERTADLAKKIFKFTFFLGLGPILIINWGGRDLFEFLLGEKWAMAGEYASYMSLWIWLVLCFSPLSLIFLVKDKQKLGMFLNMILLITRIIVILIGGFILNSASLTILLYGLSGFILWLIEGFYIWKLTDIRLKIKEKYTILTIFVSVVVLFFFKICL